MNMPLILYFAWAIIVFALTFLNGGLSLDFLTHILILIFAALQIFFYRAFFKNAVVAHRQMLFIGLSSTFAAVVEGFYMISKPISPSLLVTSSMTFSQILHNYLIDLVFTVPVYLVVFWMVWKFINKYQYKTLEYLIFISLGQALGDGLTYFAAAPVMLLLLPYVMINYQSMNLLPFLMVRQDIAASESDWRKYIVPPLAIIVAYLVLGTGLQVVAHALHVF
jgi:hypothetical protein